MQILNLFLKIFLSEMDVPGGWVLVAERSWEGVRHQVLWVRISRVKISAGMFCCSPEKDEAALGSEAQSSTDPRWNPS